MTTTFWINNPMILFQKENINQLWPKDTMTSDEKLNAITRLVIILTILDFKKNVIVLDGRMSYFFLMFYSLMLCGSIFFRTYII